MSRVALMNQEAVLRIRQHHIFQRVRRAELLRRERPSHPQSERVLNRQSLRSRQQKASRHPRPMRPELGK